MDCTVCIWNINKSNSLSILLALKNYGRNTHITIPEWIYVLARSISWFHKYDGFANIIIQKS